MNSYRMDLHVHIGRAGDNKAVKITASDSMTVRSVFQEAKQKGLQIVGIIDSHSPPVQQDLHEMLNSGDLIEYDDGGLTSTEGITCWLGSEIELTNPTGGAFHCIAYLPDRTTLREWSMWLQNHVTNIQLSTQHVYAPPTEVASIVHELGGLFVAAHAFTPFKGLYGSGVKASWTEVFRQGDLDAIELGLSSNAHLANGIGELATIPFIVGSDAHSLPKIGREWMVCRMETPTLASFEKALQNQDDHAIETYYGLPPQLGKYYETVCASCRKKGSGLVCDHCGSERLLIGVRERLARLHSGPPPQERAPYVNHVQLHQLPFWGKKRMEKAETSELSEWEILQKEPIEQLETLFGRQAAHAVKMYRDKAFTLIEGGGGTYGKLVWDKEKP